MIKYVWRILDMERNSVDGGITKIEARIVAEEFENESDNVGTGNVAFKKIAVSLNPDSSANNFIPFEDVTFDDAITFIESNTDVDQLKAGLNQELSGIKKIKGLPW
jgi:hypothetical protein